MDRLSGFGVTRFLGIAVVAGLVAWSISSFQNTLTHIESSAVSADSAGLASERAERLESSEPAPPRYLAFAVGLESGAYDIADLPDSRDRDISLSRAGKAALEAETDVGQPAVLANYVPPERGGLTPGLYGTAFDVENCSFELRRVMKTRREAVIGQDFIPEGRLLVTINEIEPDRFIASPQCGDWVPWSPVAEPLTVAGNGDYWIGDLQAGTWDVPTQCVWEKVVGFRGASLWDVETSGHGPRALVVDDDTLGVRIRGCADPLTLTSA